jgi:hypothetical protein
MTYVRRVGVTLGLGFIVAACSQASPTQQMTFNFGDASIGGSSGSGSSGPKTPPATPPVSADPDAGSPLGNHTTGASSSESVPVGASAYVVLVGGTVPTAPGTKVGYALTSPSQKTYQLRWTGEAKVVADGYHEFYGSVWTTGTFTSLTPGCTNQGCPLEVGDFVSRAENVTGGQRIDWDTFASTGWDGFSFTTDTEPIYFDVYIDGARHPELFSFPEAPSGSDTSPAATPFGISSSTQ